MINEGSCNKNNNRGLVFLAAGIHDSCLQSVFEALAKHGLTLNGSKCVFAAPAIEYVGFRLFTEGIYPLQSNVEAILSVLEPTSAAQLASFLGVTGYYVKFMPQYSAITAPLREMSCGSGLQNAPK